MSDYPIEDRMPCEAFGEDLPELAFGTLSGRRRSEALSHVASCLRCTAELEQLSTVADALLQLAPRAEPPVGFEVRVAERLQAAGAPRPRLRWRMGALAAAAAVAVLLGFSLGAGVTGGGRQEHPAAAAELTTANFTSHGRVLGELMISRGRPAWIFMTIKGHTAPGLVRCDVILRGGKVETVGAFRVSGEYGAWGAPLPSSTDVRAAQLIAPNGTLLASARVSA